MSTRFLSNQLIYLTVGKVLVTAAVSKRASSFRASSVFEYSVCNTVTQYENSTFSTSYKLEFVVVAPILLNQSTGALFPFSEISYNATIQSQRTMSYNVTCI